MQNTITAKHMKLYDEAFLTGCDETQAWMMHWFIKNFKKHSKKPLIFANFGVSDLSLNVIRANCHAVMDMTKKDLMKYIAGPTTVLPGF